MSLEVNQAAINFGTVSISVSITRLTRERIVVFSVADTESQGDEVQTTVRFPIPESGTGEPAAEPVSVASPHTASQTPPVPANILELGTSLSSDLVVGPLGTLTGEARIRRAYEIGFRHKAFLDTGVGPGPSSIITGTNKVYGILRTGRSAHSDPCWCDSFRVYKSWVGEPFLPRSISQAFPSKAELQAYFAGAGYSDLPAKVQLRASK